MRGKKTQKRDKLIMHGIKELESLSSGKSLRVVVSSEVLIGSLRSNLGKYLNDDFDNGTKLAHNSMINQSSERSNSHSQTPTLIRQITLPFKNKILQSNTPTVFPKVHD